MAIQPKTPTRALRASALQGAATVGQLMFLLAAEQAAFITIIHVVLGFLLGDVLVAVHHFMMDNYRPGSSGHKHHARVADVGFDFAASGGPDETVPCDPCDPCDPCSPASDDQVTTPGRPADSWTCERCDPCDPGPDDELSPLLRALVRSAMAPICISLGWRALAGVPLSWAVMNAMAALSAAGIPDYYAHYPHQAPPYVRLMQASGLMMSPSKHYGHHEHPQSGYAYFSPLTDFVLESLRIWGLLQLFLAKVYGMEPQPVLAMHHKGGQPSRPRAAT